MEIQLGKTYWSDEEPDVYGRQLTFDDLKSIQPDEIVLVEDDADCTPYGAVAARLYSLDDVCAKFDRGTAKLIVVCREDMNEPDEDGDDFAMVWRIRNPGEPETEENSMIEVGMRTPPADASLAVTEQYTEAYNLNVKIHTSMQAIQQNLYDMCSALKKMRDGKLYKELGYQNFEDYCENGAGIVRRHAYRFISILENLPADFVTSMSQIGMTKLALLTALTDEQREEITQTVDLESTTVRELKAQISALQAQNADAEKARLDAEERVKKWYERASEEKQKGEEMLEGCKRYWNGRAHEMEARIKELEQRPVDVAMDETAADRIKALNEELMQKKAEAAIARVRADAKAQEAADAVRAEYERKIAEMQAQKQETKPDSTLVFEAFMANAVKSIELLVDFLSAYKDDEKHPQFVAEFDAFMARVADEVAGV